MVYIKKGPELRTQESMHEEMKVKPVMHQRTYDVGDARAVRHLPRKAADKKWNP